MVKIDPRHVSPFAEALGLATVRQVPWVQPKDGPALREQRRLGAYDRVAVPHIFMVHSLARVREVVPPPVHTEVVDA